jgi:ribonuclease VapC
VVVFDSSAVLAFFNEEPGAEVVESHLQGAAISAVNLQEVAKKMLEAGGDAGETRAAIERLELKVHPHDADDAFLAASLAKATRRFGSGLGDRSCMALAIRLGVPAVTTDRVWTQLDIPGLDVVLAR